MSLFTEAMDSICLSLWQLDLGYQFIQPLYGGSTMWQIDVDKDKCNGDAECVNACPAQVYEIIDGKSEPVNADECLGCETCVEVCPEGAITVTEV